MTRTVVITGANRGIGLGLTRYFLARGDRVIATARNPDKAAELQQLRQRHIEQCMIETLDVRSPLSVKAFAKKCEELGPIDILINNAGVYLDGQASFAELDLQKVHDTIAVNSVGPMLMVQELLPCLTKSSKPVVANITSKMGSIADNTSGGSYAYRMSKAALNMFNKSFAIDFPLITSVVFHPGWVETEMGGKAAPTKVESSAQGLGKQIDQLTSEMSGRFFDYQGVEIPW